MVNTIKFVSDLQQ